MDELHGTLEALLAGEAGETLSIAAAGSEHCVQISNSGEGELLCEFCLGQWVHPRWPTELPLYFNHSPLPQAPPVSGESRPRIEPARIERLRAIADEEDCRRQEHFIAARLQELFDDTGADPKRYLELGLDSEPGGIVAYMNVLAVLSAEIPAMSRFTRRVLLEHHGVSPDAALRFDRL